MTDAGPASAFVPFSHAHHHHPLHPDLARQRHGHLRRRPCEANPEGTPIEALDEIRAAVLADRSQFYQDLSIPLFGANRSGAAVSQGARDAFWLQSRQAGLKSVVDCVKQFSETDFTEDLRQVDVPVLLAHGDDDQIVTIRAAALQAAKLLETPTLRVYPGAPHGITGAYEQEFNADLLAFLAR